MFGKRPLDPKLSLTNFTKARQLNGRNGALIKKGIFFERTENSTQEMDIEFNEINGIEPPSPILKQETKAQVNKIQLPKKKYFDGSKENPISNFFKGSSQFPKSNEWQQAKNFTKSINSDDAPKQKSKSPIRSTATGEKPYFAWKEVSSGISTTEHSFDSKAEEISKPYFQEKLSGVQVLQKKSASPLKNILDRQTHSSTSIIMRSRSGSISDRSESPHLHTMSRAEERGLFNQQKQMKLQEKEQKKLKEQEEIKKREEELVKKYRNMTIFKARKVPRFNVQPVQQEKSSRTFYSVKRIEDETSSGI